MIVFNLLLLFAPTGAATATPAARPKYVMDVAEGKVVCRLITEAGSRIPTRVCRTELQWEEMAKENQDSLRSSRNSRGTGCNGMIC